MTGEAAALTETHSAVVVFVGDHAYKVKKPVDLGFLDFSTREAREAICHREVELNRRLAPDVYLGVADIRDHNGEVCDHLVVMRRMSPERRLSHLVTTGQSVDDDLWQLAHLLAAFHARADRSPAADEAAGAAALGARWAANTAELVANSSQYVDHTAIEALDQLAQRYLAGRGPLFERRIADGRACDGHGDLLADDIFCLSDGPRVLDCIEFDDRLRYGDALADVAFLAMDLERLGRPDLASRFLAAYREHSADTWPASLAHHHIAYRAQIRTKVAVIRAGQGHAASVDEARRLLDLALEHLDAGRVRLITVGGLPGTGKSTLAAGLSDALGTTLLRSDEIRKEISGLRPDEPSPASLGEGIYRPEVTATTYSTLMARAQTALSHGESVIIDASFQNAESRDETRQLAISTASDLHELCCTAPTDLANARMTARAARRRDPSDATPDIAGAMAATFEPWTSATKVDTSGPPDRALAHALAHVQPRARNAEIR